MTRNMRFPGGKKRAVTLGKGKPKACALNLQNFRSFRFSRLKGESLSARCKV